MLQRLDGALSDMAADGGPGNEFAEGGPSPGVGCIKSFVNESEVGSREWW